MKTIKKTTIIKTIRKEFKECRGWCREDFERYYALMIDTRDASIWSDVFLSSNEWRDYKSDTIHQLDGLVQIRSVKNCEQAYIDDAVRLLASAGWEIV